MAGETFLSRQGYEKLRDDLARLKERRGELSGEIGEAREKGDLKENAEYHAAKEEQAKVQRRINEVEEKLRSAQIIDESNVAEGEIRIGATAHLKEVKSGESLEYTLVDAAEADFSKGWISVQSPVAQALLGHKEGEQVTVNLPAGPVLYHVTKVSRSLT
ncbi:MAG: transcription elongation factor GreA [Elusimicrobia bacterium]|jgi:transcription elongation factor GreA|nr:transcription elongation factor GreA [Elusimicrobiota bacterium]